MGGSGPTLSLTKQIPDSNISGRSSSRASTPSSHAVLIDRSSIDDTFTAYKEGSEYDPMAPNDYDAQEEEMALREKARQAKAKLDLQLELREAREREERRRKKNTQSFQPRGLTKSTMMPTPQSQPSRVGAGRGRANTACMDDTMSETCDY